MGSSTEKQLQCSTTFDDVFLSTAPLMRWADCLGKHAYRADEQLTHAIKKRATELAGRPFLIAA